MIIKKYDVKSYSGLCLLIQDADASSICIPTYHRHDAAKRGERSECDG